MISQIINLPNGMIDIIEVEGTLEQELASVLNKKSLENASDTPDYLLAQYLIGCLEVWNKTVIARDKWYGWSGLSRRSYQLEE